MKRKLFVLALVIAGLYIVLQIRGRQIAYWRLARLEIVSRSCEVKHIHSTGVLRENTHTFQVLRTCLVGEAAVAHEDLQPIQPPEDDGYGGRVLFQKSLRDALPDVRFEDHRFAYGFHEPTLTMYWLVFPSRGDTAYVLLHSM